MILPQDFHAGLLARGIGFFAGVPDSLLKSFCAWIDHRAAPGTHLIAANEGNAVALAMGHHLATGKVGAVYMQNSGLGNAINPLTSLLDPEVYRIPLLLIVGWRGEPGVPDEPQHVKQGRITPAQLDLLGIPYWVLEAGSDPDATLDAAFASLRERGAPVALLVRKDAFAEVDLPPRAGRNASMKREEALRELLVLAGSALVVATTGKTSREVFELRAAAGAEPRDFLTVGGMGHTSSIALGVALGRPGRRVVCLDGDGSMLMHLGALPIIGSVGASNLVHVLLNNAAHESVGGQPTVADEVDFDALARACGYRSYARADDLAGLRACWASIEGREGPHFLQVEIAIGSRANLGRPTSTPEQNKIAFMRAVAPPT